jgi:hypothetical protein
LSRSELDSGDDPGDGAAASPDIGRKRGGGEVEAEQDAEEGMPDAQSSEADQEPDQDAQEEDEGDRQDQQGDLFSIEGRRTK